MRLRIDFGSWKVWAIIAGLIVASSVGFGTVWSYLKTGHRWLGKTIRANVPLEFDIERLETQIQEARDQVRHDEQDLAYIEVQCEQLEQEINNLSELLPKLKREIDELAGFLDGSEQYVTIGSVKYSRAEVEGELQRRMDDYEHRESILEQKRKTLAERRQYVEGFRKALEENRRKVELLALDAEKLREQKRLLDSTPTAGSRFDSNKIAQAEQLAQELLAKLRAEQRVREKYVSRPRIELPSTQKSAMERYREKFGNQAKEAANESFTSKQ